MYDDRLDLAYTTLCFWWSEIIFSRFIRNNSFTASTNYILGGNVNFQDKLWFTNIVFSKDKEKHYIITHRSCDLLKLDMYLKTKLIEMTSLICSKMCKLQHDILFKNVVSFYFIKIIFLKRKGWGQQNLLSPSSSE